MPKTARRAAASTRPAARRPRSVSEDPGTRERILDTALRSFAELGFDGSSTRAIASRAGVNHGLIPYYFGTKDELWREAVSRAFERLERGLGQAADAEEVGDRERLALMIRRYVRFVAANPEFVMLMNEEGKREGKRMRWLVDTHVRPIAAAMTGLYESARGESGLPGQIGALHFHYIFAGAVGTLFHQAPECRRVFGVDPADPEVVEAHADALIQLFLGAPAPEGEPPASAPARQRRKK